MCGPIYLDPDRKLSAADNISIVFPYEIKLQLFHEAFFVPIRHRGCTEHPLTHTHVPL